MKTIFAFLPLSILTSGLLFGQAKSPAQFWRDSVTSETNRDYASALAQMAAYQSSGGSAFLGNLRQAWLYYLNQDYASAAKFYHEAERLQPTAINPLLGLLNVSEAQGNPDEIEKAAENILHLDPLNYRAQMVSAYRQYLNKNYAIALADYRRVLTYYPDDMIALSGEAWSLYFLG
jgi:tetratricopeptide (TPR) repeat protein